MQLTPCLGEYFIKIVVSIIIEYLPNAMRCI